MLLLQNFLCFARALYDKITGMNQTEERFTQLETKLAYMEDFIEKLQNVTVEHEKTIEELKIENEILKTKVKEMVFAIEEIPHTRPPHY